MKSPIMFIVLLYFSKQIKRKKTMAFPRHVSLSGEVFEKKKGKKPKNVFNPFSVRKRQLRQVNKINHFH